MRGFRQPSAAFRQRSAHFCRILQICCGFRNYRKLAVSAQQDNVSLLTRGVIHVKTLGLIQMARGRARSERTGCLPLSGIALFLTHCISFFAALTICSPKPFTGSLSMSCPTSTNKILVVAYNEGANQMVKLTLRGFSTHPSLLKHFTRGRA